MAWRASSGRVVRLKRACRHLEWHELLEALSAGGCAVCALVERATRRHIRSLLHESVNDPGVRERVRRSRGFCARHVAMLLETPDVLGLAILAADVVGEVARRLDGDLKTSQDARTAAICPLCDEAARVEADTLSTLAGGLADEGLRTRYAAGEGLCLPHLARLAAQCDPADRAWLGQTEFRMLEALRQQLNEIIRKNDYRYQNEPWGEERDAWQRALRKLAGSQAVDLARGRKG